MRSQALKLLQRLPFSGLAAQDGVQAVRLLSSSAVSGEASSLLQSLQGKKQESIQSVGLPQFNKPQLSFAAQMHALASQKDDEKQVAPASPAALAAQEAKVPTALMALPPKKTTGVRSMGSAAAGVHPHAAHPFHVLPPSCWPALGGFGAFATCLGMCAFFHAIPGGTAAMLTGLLCTTATAVSWWRDCIIESDLGMHTEVQKRNLMSGVWIFIVSEAALFFGLLWSCVHLGMSPNVTIQMQWPPVGIEAVGWDKRALVMSAVLAASYYSANVAMVAKDPKAVMGALGTTLALGALFLGDQYLEYSQLPFTITDSAYGSTFFLTTGFHGMHVLLGAIWLATCMAMYPRYHSPGVGMRGGILYWHFVDIVWIAVYGIIYVAQL
mmetsp:Transcript_16516/g.35719  ORF Transcript_16516/g.35719 Transcript_16516/m.35719 type:complete len:382 (-) Transcript_16516:367-1512(-)|eukprot:CAMPEP_0202898062 /NCGR_PEP_ID=MMETSP1392-20130828/6670_1 /ASSEMBLY_ACC=CAM_ASM_000868 /TAXON_ID=225041 /ORGANISM="Chlamydomonas chlamydogama, Strain SAG 11-48b" /LENGTH=381 /DNA_ID=CAMNT_0049583885 /DNA_START=147 /DNA_END=1292 /DNA_ORIENTATION=-